MSGASRLSCRSRSCRRRCCRPRPAVSGCTGWRTRRTPRPTGQRAATARARCDGARLNEGGTRHIGDNPLNATPGSSLFRARVRDAARQPVTVDGHLAARAGSCLVLSGPEPPRVRERRRRRGAGTRVQGAWQRRLPQQVGFPFSAVRRIARRRRWRFSARSPVALDPVRQGRRAAAAQCE